MGWLLHYFSPRFSGTLPLSSKFCSAHVGFLQLDKPSTTTRNLNLGVSISLFYVRSCLTAVCCSLLTLSDVFRVLGQLQVEISTGDMHCAQFDLSSSTVKILIRHLNVHPCSSSSCNNHKENFASILYSLLWFSAPSSILYLSVSSFLLFIFFSSYSLLSTLPSSSVKSSSSSILSWNICSSF